MPSVRRKLRFYGQTAFWPLRLPFVRKTRQQRKAAKQLDQNNPRPTVERQWQMCQECALCFSSLLTRRHIFIRHSLRGEGAVGRGGKTAGGALLVEKLVRKLTVSWHELEEGEALGVVTGLNSCCRGERWEGGEVEGGGVLVTVAVEGWEDGGDVEGVGEGGGQSDEALLLRLVCQVIVGDGFGGGIEEAVVKASARSQELVGLASLLDIK